MKRFCTVFKFPPPHLGDVQGIALLHGLVEFKVLRPPHRRVAGQPAQPQDRGSVEIRATLSQQGNYL
eukprot:1067777-Rhodomonas_salina.1